MKYDELIEKVTPWATLPRGYTWDDIPEPRCSHCNADLESITLSRIPAKTGKRGNPTLLCKCCGKQWAFPKLRVGGPTKASVGLTEMQIMVIYGNIPPLGLSAHAHVAHMGLSKEYLPEVRAILSIPKDVRVQIESKFGDVAVETLAKEFHVSIPNATALYRGWVYRERLRTR